ncbi:MAG: tetratricopeptide repeat protein [Polyangiales bacterium]
MAPPAPTEQQVQARALFQQGQAAYASGNYEAAIESWNQAFALDPRPQLQYNLAQAYGRLGQLEQELTALQAFVAGGLGDPNTLAAASARITAVQERLARTGIEVRGTQGAEVRVDDQDLGTLPLSGPVRLPAGAHRVVVRMRGHYPRTETVQLSPGDVTVVQADLEVVHQPSIVPPLALWAGGGAALLTGAILGGVALSKADGAAPGSSEADKAQGLALGADICLGVGAAAAVAGTVLFFVRRVDPDEVSGYAIDVQPVIGPNTAGLVLRGRL